VRDRDDVREIAAVATETYGGFGTRVNGAGSFVYGRPDETPVEEMRAQSETNVRGLLYGSLEAADHLSERGGAIINVDSVASDVAIPLQGSYSASKHAVQGFTDALRTELAEEGAPVSVTLVKPAAIDTPYPEHARNHMDAAATLPPPVYAPETAANAILHAAEHPERDVTVGGGGKPMTTLGALAPGVMDTVLARLFVTRQRKDRPPRPGGESGLEEPTGDLEARGGHEGHVAESSLYTAASRRGSLAAAAVLGLAVAVLYALYGSASGSESDRSETPSGTRGRRVVGGEWPTPALPR